MPTIATFIEELSHAMNEIANIVAQVSEGMSEVNKKFAESDISTEPLPKK